MRFFRCFFACNYASIQGGGGDEFTKMLLMDPLQEQGDRYWRHSTIFDQAASS